MPTSVKYGLTVMLLLALFPGVRGGNPYAGLDEKIVAAYNATPKRTQDVYIYAMQILEKTNQDRSDSASDWESKSRQLITIACFCETDRALNNNDRREAYLWCKRGTANGASRGDLDGVDLKQVFEYLKSTSGQLEQDPEVQEMSRGQTMRAILDYRTVKKSNLAFPRDKRDVAGRPVEEERNYEIIAGPTHDGDGKIYVKIRYKFGAEMKIRYYRKQGWQAVNPPDRSKTGYYLSWQECAAANAKIGNLSGVPQEPLRNRAETKKVYYEPSSPSTGGKP
ncbi:MAG: hypothetical protein PHQ27_06750 [Victivallales bacterium]|nr:hypothetical protein [Victivallales bacterium]